MDSSAPITVAIGHFEDLLAIGLQTLLEADPSVEVVAKGVAPERISVVLLGHEPLVAILDLDSLRDPAQVRELSVSHPETHLVLLGHQVSVAESAQMLAFGASACLAKSAQSRDIQSALHLASRGLQLMPSGARGTAATIQNGLMTQREGEVLQLLRKGRSNGEIALELGIGVETVRTHARNIFRKLGVSSRRALIAQPEGVAPAPVPAAEAAARRPRARTRGPAGSRHH